MAWATDQGGNSRTTLAALTGWYLCATLIEDLGGHGFVGDLRLEFAANRVWFVAGLISGPLFGVLGTWWHRTRSLSAGVVAGVLLMGEPIVMALLTLLHESGVVTHGAGLPLLLRVVANTWVQGGLAESVLAAEFAVGAAVVTLALRRSARRRTPGGQQNFSGLLEEV
jgi:MFS family permease